MLIYSSKACFEPLEPGSKGIAQIPLFMPQTSIDLKSIVPLKRLYQQMLAALFSRLRPVRYRNTDKSPTN